MTTELEITFKDIENGKCPRKKMSSRTIDGTRKSVNKIIKSVPDFEASAARFIRI